MHRPAPAPATEVQDLLTLAATAGLTPLIGDMIGPAHKVHFVERDGTERGRLILNPASGAMHLWWADPYNDVHEYDVHCTHHEAAWVIRGYARMVARAAQRALAGVA